MNRPLVIGTRGSALALAQVELFKKALRLCSPEVRVQVRTVTTTGDRKQEISLAIESGAGLKGLFTREIEELLLRGEVDVAVHSLKDLPGHTPQGLAITAVLERADTSDVLIAKSARSLTEVPVGGVIATSSVRRSRQLRWMRPDVRIEEIRGNVPTRVQKLRDSGHWHGIVLARAGLDRLGFDAEGFQVSPLATLPAIGQGAIGLETRDDATEVNALVAGVNHLPTFTCIRAERELLRLLNGDCHLPVGVATLLAGDQLSMSAIVFGEEGQPPAEAQAHGSASAPEALAQHLHTTLGNNAADPR